MINNSVKKRKLHTEDKNLSSYKKVIKGKELDQIEELSIKIDLLVELLSEKGIINKKGYTNNLMMRLHETSKAKTFEEMDEEI